jgi:hypothetical protein
MMCLISPEGTILIKNFYYPTDLNKPAENLRILETRLLINESGIWKALPYIWNDEQTEAYLNVAGKNLDVSWKHTDGQLAENKLFSSQHESMQGLPLAWR